MSFQAQAFSNDCLLICTWSYYDSLSVIYDFQLHLVKSPYVEISKSLEIETQKKGRNAQLFGLKDYFVYIKIDESNEKGKKNITYAFIDFDLNIVNSLTEQYENYSELLFFDLSFSHKVNEFLICVLKEEDISENLETYKCQVIKYENNDLSYSKNIDISISSNRYYLKTCFFDENKIGLSYSINDYHNHNYIYILQYENQVLSFYKNYKNLALPSLALSYASFE